MSATEILSELPKLKREERRAIARRVFELEDEREELEWAAQAADLAFQELDKLESDRRALQAERGCGSSH